MEVEGVEVDGDKGDDPVATNAEFDKSKKQNVTENSSEIEVTNHDNGESSKPYVGMEFDSEDAAKTFYDAYARRMGFSTHVGPFTRAKPDGPIITWDFACSREVFKRKNVESCNAVLRIERKDSEKWTVTKFVEDHNHSMVTPNKVQYLRPRRHFAGATKNVAEALDVSGDVYITTDGNHLSYEPNSIRNSLPVDPSQFESSWCSLLDKYDLQKNEWLHAVYNARRQWAPVYFRGTFFAALSSNQGISSFFDGYVHQQTTIPLFFKQYERALENSREKEIELDYDTICTTPVLKTPSPMEQQAANLYTKKVFAKFQEELVGALAVETYNVAISALKEAGKKVLAVKKNVAKISPPSSQVVLYSQEDSNKKTPPSVPEMIPSLWPWQEAMPHRFNLNDSGVSVSDLNQPSMVPVSFHRDCGTPDSTVVLTCFKSMTWVIENKNSTSASKVAVINLKLQDYGKKPSGETEVQFRLTKTTLEPMLRSMAYISQQLSAPANKVAVINLKLQDTKTTSGEAEVKFQVSRDTLGSMLRSLAYIREQL
ncbi:hypothetical protein CUMW_123780 [Citrus unshiu]|nr:hypothetical protein CUMW_123780 [Citrus unshiu]GAY50057.1 hypothetical protein CUMW_123780 [Citrus unshiu]